MHELAILESSTVYSWFATTWQGGHVGGQNKRIFPRRIYMKIEILLFLTTNMAAVTSRANQQLSGNRVTLMNWSRGLNMVTGDATGLTSVVMSYTQRQQICNKKTRTHSGLSLNKGLFNNNKNSCILSRLKILYLACSRVTNSQYCLICH